MRTVSSRAVVHGPAGSAAVAAGSVGAVEAGIEVLRAGGSAVDAVLACAFASPVTEPVLSSLGGGGFLLHAAPGAEPEVLDFFVAVPGVGGVDVEPRVTTVVIDFAKAGPAASSSEQVFHGGWGTVAVPGCLTGYLDAHRRWGRLPLADVVAPAARLARDGVELSPVQRRFVTLVTELLQITDDSRAAVDALVSTGMSSNSGYADLLDALAAGEVTGVADPAFADRLLAASGDGGGLLTAADLAAYSAVLRRPLAADRDGARIWSNPPPSAGGSIVLDALSRLHPSDVGIDWADVAAAQAAATAAHRAPGQVATGTTHASVVAADGSVAALTTSNGSGSGTLVPGWGVALNNMLGEEDLQPGVPLAPGQRMGSMMAPTLIARPDGSLVVLGTGGSERIRSALVCVLARLLDADADLADAVEAPRVHVGPDHQIHVEPGLSTSEADALTRLAAARGWPAIDVWPTPNVYFGGVHAVRRAADGTVTAVGDARRGGAAAVLRPDGTVERVSSEDDVG
jgi:gamma-glutamyltranspeptidase/glutathione hydrolase